MSGDRGRRLLLAYDGSPAARAALARAAEIARPRDEVSVVNVMPEPGVSCRLAPFTEERHRQATLLRDAADHLAERGIAIRPCAAVGDEADETLAAAARIAADLIIVGESHGRLPRVLGSPCDRIVRRAACDVLVVHDAPGHGTRGGPR